MEKQLIVVNWANEKDSLRHLVLTGKRLNKAEFQFEQDPYDWILSLTNPEEAFQSMEFDFSESSEIIQDSRFKKDGYYYIRLLFEDRTRFNIYLVDEDGLDQIIEKDSLCEIVLDKDNRYGATRKATDLSRRIQEPQLEEFESWYNTFFTEMTDLAFYLKNNSLLSGQICLSRARKPLLEIMAATISSNSDYTFNPGEDYCHLEAYLDEEQKEYLQATFVGSNKKDLWDALFKACVLFRKAGLSLAENTGFTYPKKMDVDLLRKYREIWEEDQ